MQPAGASKERTRFVSRGIQWLHFLGWLDEPELEHHPHHAKVAIFEKWLREGARPSTTTIQDCCAYHGIERFCTLSHAKGIYEQGRWNLSNLLRAPFRQPIPQRDAPVTEMASSKGTREHQHMTADASLPLRGSCECGACSFEVHTSPKARFRCHCLICQAFNGKPFADVVAIRAKDVVLKNAGNISFKKYRPPPNFNRGVCRTCGKPVVEVAGVGPFKVMFIPASNFEPEAPLPPVRMDIFYHRRVLDMADSLPKYSGYYPSQLAIGKMIMSGL